MQAPKKVEKIHVKKDDLVIVISGKDKGKKGKVLSAMPKQGKVIVEGVNIATKHKKPRAMGPPGGIIKQEAAIYASKVMLVCPRCGKAYHEPPALSRLDNETLVCPDCGTREALESIGVSTEEQDSILETIHRATHNTQ